MSLRVRPLGHAGNLSRMSLKRQAMGEMIDYIRMPRDKDAPATGRPLAVSLGQMSVKGGITRRNRRGEIVSCVRL